MNERLDNVLAERRGYLRVRRIVECVFVVPAMFGLGVLVPLLLRFKLCKALWRNALLLLRGSVALVGPSREFSVAGIRVRAGIFNEAAIAQDMGLEDSVEELDSEYLRTLSPKADLSLFLKGSWVTLMGSGPSTQANPSNHFNLFDVFVNNSTTPGVLKTIDAMLAGHSNTLSRLLRNAGGDATTRETQRPCHICFVNANNFNLAIEQPDYAKVLREAEVVLPDGIGVKLALQMAGGRLNKNLNGTDLFPHLAAMFEAQNASAFVLGAEPEVLSRAIAAIQAAHPGFELVGSRDGFFKLEDEAALCEEINSSGAAVLLIGMGTPRQELFVGRNLDRLQVSLIFSLGGLLDFLGGKNKRAPRWMRQAGLEWVFRILQEPGRMWRRYVVGNPVFLWRARRWIRERSNVTKGRASAA